MRFFMEMDGHLFEMVTLDIMGWQCHKCDLREDGGRGLCKRLHSICSGFCGLIAKNRLHSEAHYFKEVKSE